MALRVWLPLDGSSLINKGNISKTFVGKNLIYGTDMTLGQSVLVGGYVTIDSSTMSTVQQNSKITISCMVKGENNSKTKSNYGFLGVYDINRTLSAFRYPNKDYIQISDRAGEISIPNALFDDSWHHLCVTRSSGGIFVYVDGCCRGSIRVIPSWSANDYYIGIANIGASNTVDDNDVSIYDFRIYDEVLTEEKIVELAGKRVPVPALHYKLNKPLDNLLINSDIYNVIQHTSSAKDGYAHYKIYTNGLDTTKTYTLSCDCDGTLFTHDGGSGYDPKLSYWTIWLYQDSALMTESSYAHYATATNFNKNSATLKKVGNHYSWTFKPSYPNVSVRINSYSNGTDNSVITVKNIKLEEGEIDTPWVPSKADAMYSALGYDDVCEYKYQGTRFGKYDSNAYGKMIDRVRTTSNDYSLNGEFNYQWSAGTDKYSFWTLIGKTNFNSQFKYRIKGRVKIVSGSFSKITLLFYNLSSSKDFGRTDVDISKGYFELTTAPTSETCPNLLIYCGLAGSTQNNSIKIENLCITELDCFDTDYDDASKEKYFIVGERKFSSDSPVYKTSMIFNNNCLFAYDPIQSGSDFSISMWFKSNDVTQTQCLWNGRTDVGGAIGIFIINSKLRIDDSSQTYCDDVLSNNTWYHLVVTLKRDTKRGNETKKLYLNGVMKFSVTTSNFSKSNTYFSIGMSSDSSSVANASISYQRVPSGNVFSGKMSDIRVYMCELTESEILELYNKRGRIDSNGNITCKELIEK